MAAFGVDASQINFPDGHVDYSKVHDQVVAIDPYNMTVTLNLINGFSFGRPVWYISMDASIPLAAAIEHNTYAPLMSHLLLGHDDSFASPVERIFITTNGPETGECNNPLRQGLSADLADVSDRTTCLAEFRQLHSTTVRRGTRSCINGRMTLSVGVIAGSCGRSSRF
jgi:hypothetical protein